MAKLLEDLDRSTFSGYELVNVVSGILKDRGSDAYPPNVVNRALIKTFPDDALNIKNIGERVLHKVLYALEHLEYLEYLENLKREYDTKHTG